MYESIPFIRIMLQPTVHPVRALGPPRDGIPDRADNDGGPDYGDGQRLGVLLHHLLRDGLGVAIRVGPGANKLSEKGKKIHLDDVAKGLPTTYFLSNFGSFSISLNPSTLCPLSPGSE